MSHRADAPDDRTDQRHVCPVIATGLGRPPPGTEATDRWARAFARCGLRRRPLSSSIMKAMRDAVIRWVTALGCAAAVLGIALGVAFLFLVVMIGLALTGTGPATAVADRIRSANSPIVREVRFSGPGLEGGSDRITVLLTDDATEAQALDLWCTVIVPVGVAQLPRANLTVQQGEKPDPGGGVTGGRTILPIPTSVDGPFFCVDPTCPASASQAPSP